MTASLRSAPFFIAASLLVACAHPAPQPPAANATVAAPNRATGRTMDLNKVNPWMKKTMREYSLVELGCGGFLAY